MRIGGVDFPELLLNTLRDRRKDRNGNLPNNS